MVSTIHHPPRAFERQTPWVWEQSSFWARLTLHQPSRPIHQVHRCLYGFKQQRMLTSTRYYSEGSRRYPHSSTSHSIGLCTGSFAAAAISTSQTVAELLPAAIEAVLVAFRTGLRSFEARNDIEPCSVSPPVWSVIVGVQEGQASALLDSFSRAKVISPRQF